jgi:hypothetical protein
VPVRVPTATSIPTPTPTPTEGSLKIGLVAQYPFNGNANDESGNGNNGVAHGAALANDRFGKADSVSFDGFSSYVEVLAGSHFNFPVDMSIALWVKPNAYNAWGTVMDKSNWNGNSHVGGFAVFATTPNFNTLGCVYVHDTTAEWDGAPAVLFPVNQWTHLVFVKQNSVSMIFMNGILQSQKTLSFSSILPNGDLPLVIGADNFGATNPASNVQHFFSGQIDDIYIYNRALTPNEITELYNDGGTPAQSPTNSPATDDFIGTPGFAAVVGVGSGVTGVMILSCSIWQWKKVVEKALSEID